MKKKKIINKSILLLVVFLFFFVPGCRKKPSFKGTPHFIYLTATGYCPCKKCTGWKRNWKFQPVYAYGPKKGQPKEVGIAADGTKAEKGIIAADTNFYPFGTVFYIPNYGYGVVHDRGGGINGKYHIDLFFPSHTKALQWGRKKLKVQFWQ